MSSLERILKAYEQAGSILPSQYQCRQSCDWRQSLDAICGPCGGAGRSRTDDILLAKQALYQLSYGPVPQEQCEAQESLSVRSPQPALKQQTPEGFALAPPAKLVGPGRLELPTSRLSGVRSNQAELRAYGRTTA